MYNEIFSTEEFQKIKSENPAFLIYLSHENCSVCKVLKPKVHDLIIENFPKISLFYCDTINSSELAAQLGVFAVPTILVYFEGREFFRISRNISINELKHSIERPYSLIFE